MLDPKYGAAVEKSTTRKFIERSLPYLPEPIAQPFRARWQSYYVSKEQLDATLTESSFKQFQTWRMVNRFIACEATKPDH